MKEVALPVHTKKNIMPIYCCKGLLVIKHMTCQLLKSCEDIIQAKLASPLIQIFIEINTLFFIRVKERGLSCCEVHQHKELETY